MFDVDGAPLSHWDKSNFERERDETCRVVYKPRGGAEFFEKNLKKEEYAVMRRISIEQPFFSKYNRFFPKRGHFCCKGCGNPLYSHNTKLDKFDGWPAFGACVEGSVGMITPDQRKDKEEREQNAAIMIQSIVRGNQARASVFEKLGLLMEKVQQLEQEFDEKGIEAAPLKDGVDDEPFDQELDEESIEEASLKDEEEDEPYDAKPSMHISSHRKAKLLDTLSLHSLHEFDLLSVDSSHSGDSFGGDDSFSNDAFDEPIFSKPTARRQRSSFQSPYKPPSSQLGDDFIEIHCHRCKSHLGNVMEERNRGRDGTTKYRERHRVNGRAMKYVEDNLPKRIRTDFSLLFASQTERRLLGLQPVKVEKEESEVLFGRDNKVPFVSPRSKKKKSVQQTLSSPVPGFKPGVGVHSVSFQSPKSAQKRGFKSKKKNLENFFLTRSVH